MRDRHYPIISMERKLDLTVEERKEHDKDIAIYLYDKLKQRDKEIEEGLLKKASGVPMWVVLVFEMLNQAFENGRITAMLKCLCEVPSDLDDMFWSLLGKGNQDRPETILMLQRLLFSK
ncbi:MAG: hypothetical protein M1840_008596 [Geoglossum simile]|nr:MAG: hypothetical protein M1840_008596 [Geoglossum simile]